MADRDEFDDIELTIIKGWSTSDLVLKCVSSVIRCDSDWRLRCIWRKRIVAGGCGRRSIIVETYRAFIAGVVIGAISVR